MVSLTIIAVGVLAFAALLGWWLLREMASAARAQRDPQYRGRVMRRLLLTYVALQVGRNKLRFLVD
jgi:Tfp pilus assembly protein PilV